jgi:fumarate reductase iron-sulfur subunit
VAVVLSVFRYAPGSPASTQEYRVETTPGATVLDALVRIRETQDPTLAFRYACRVGMCGSCAMVVNGRETWACRMRLTLLRTDTVTVRPLYHFPVIRDLVVDMAPFVEKMKRAGAAFVPRADTSADPPPLGVGGSRGGPEGSAGPQAKGRPDGAGGRRRRDQLDVGTPPRGRQSIDAAIQCIGCGACVSACTMVRWDRAFPGPAALNRAFTLAADGRDGGGASRWDALFGEDGVWRCHGQAQCTAVCPMELSPTESILALRRLALRSVFSRT